MTCTLFAVTTADKNASCSSSNRNRLPPPSAAAGSVAAVRWLRTGVGFAGVWSF
ncbi:BnaC01g10060D [Brassica napus]|uniref:BnaC01g10060D protein n=1 Tax=Brassica napus TaxID=3708 RepID=A0A078HKJ5_BRANA|nr:BnaC01g10060D [Brassica napus]